MPDRDTMERRAHRQALDRLAATQRRAKGGILKGEHYRNFTVNIRPSRWIDQSKPSQFWIGKIGSFERAQQVADAIYFYTGKEPFHIKDVVRWYPSITCMGVVPGTPEVLSTQEMFRSYTAAIARGVQFQLQRKDFIAQVEKVIEMPDFPNMPAPPEDDLEHDEGEDTPGIEYDDSAALALTMFSNGGTSAVRPGSVSLAAEFKSLSGVDSVQGFLPGFDVQPSDSGSILRSEGQSIGSIPLPESMDDCPTSQDEESFQEWTQAIDALPSSIAAISTLVSDAEVDQESSELDSPILRITLSVDLSAFSIFEPPFASVAPEERADTAPGNPEDWQLARNKRRKIAGH